MKRFGRNQKRELRALIEEQKAVISTQHEALKFAGLAVCQATDILRTIKRICPLSVSLPPSSEVADVNYISVQFPRLKAEVVSRSLDVTTPDLIQIMTVDTPQLEIELIDDREFNRAIHFVARSGLISATKTYHISPEGLAGIDIEEISKEIATHLAFEASKL